MGGEALHVPADADKETLREYTNRIQREMDRLNALVEEMAAEGAPLHPSNLTREFSTSQ